MNYANDSRTVVTLDAGGTNFVFGAIRGNQNVVEPITMPSMADNLDNCMAQLRKGFQMVIDQLAVKPVAISFAFPGPADYPAGIIGGYLPNFPSFRDGVALGPSLSEYFSLPVYINNDADLFAYGEAIAGALPEVNRRLSEAGSAKQYKNMLGYTFGTGFGIGVVTDNKLHIGDNSCTETFCLNNKKYPGVMVEESVSIRAIKRVYGEKIGNPDHGLDPKQISEVIEGKREGDKQAALAAYAEMGEIAGDAMATAVTIIDGLIVIGGGPTGAKQYIYPALLKEMRSQIKTLAGEPLDKVQMKVYNLDDEAEFKEFAKGQQREIKVYGTDKTVSYDPEKRIGIITSELGASRAISLGAYAFALSKIDGE